MFQLGAVEIVELSSSLPAQLFDLRIGSANDLLYLSASRFQRSDLRPEAVDDLLGPLRLGRGRSLRLLDR